MEQAYRMSKIERMEGGGSKSRSRQDLRNKGGDHDYSTRGTQSVAIISGQETTVSPLIHCRLAELRKQISRTTKYPTSAGSSALSRYLVKSSLIRSSSFNPSNTSKTSSTDHPRFSSTESSIIKVRSAVMADATETASSTLPSSTSKAGVKEAEVATSPDHEALDTASLSSRKTSTSEKVIGFFSGLLKRPGTPASEGIPQQPFSEPQESRGSDSSKRDSDVNITEVQMGTIATPTSVTQMFDVSFN